MTNLKQSLGDIMQRLNEGARLSQNDMIRINELY
jgi:hypothetical protein